MKLALVTGATGQVGRHVVHGLVEKSVPARALTRDPVKAERLFADIGIRNGDIEIVRGDFTDPASLHAAADGCAQVFVASADHPDQLRLEMNVVRAALEAGDCHIVKLSSCDAAPDAPYAWGRNHVAVESQVIMRTTDNFSFLRPHFFMQNLLSFANEVRDRGSLSAPAGTGRIGMIDARDIAAVAVEVLSSGKPLRRAAELTGPRPVSFAEAVAALSAAIGRQVRYADISGDEHMRILTEERNVTPGPAADIIRNYQDMRAGAFDTRTDEVERITGQRPRSIEQFAQDYAGEFK
jgi:uncharacterized protein YbjT (DUF2867 family)